MISEVSPSARVTLDATGNGQVSVGPPPGSMWTARLASVRGDSTITPTVSLYRGSTSGPNLNELIDASFLGNGASSSLVAGAPFFPGQVVWAVWSGGSSGAAQTLQVFARQASGDHRRLPFDPGPMGPGFQGTLATVLRAGSGQTMILAGTEIPAALQTYYQTTFGWTLGLVELMTVDGFNKYSYRALTANGVAIVGGWVDAGTVYPVTIENASPAPGLAYNGDPAASPLTWPIISFGLASSVQLDGQFTIDLVGAPRGWRDSVSSIVNSAAIGAEAIILTGNAITWRDRWVYRVRYGGMAFGSVVNNATYQIRRTNLAGAVKHQTRFPCQAGAAAALHHESDNCLIMNNSGADITDNIVLTVAASAGTVTQAGLSTLPRRLEIEHVGNLDFGPPWTNAVQI